jgi:altronate dehydratase
MRDRAARPKLVRHIVECVNKAARYYSIMGRGSFAVGNADGGLTTQEENSLGAYAKSGGSQIVGIQRTHRTMISRSKCQPSNTPSRTFPLLITRHQ